MKLQIIAVHDSAAQAFGAPQFVLSTGHATRAFGDQVNSEKEGPLKEHPQDFILFHLGEFDDGTGLFDLFPQPRQLVRGADVKRP